ncbi:UTP--glucose-1-phosphate uridylyltransferase GalU [Vibrio sp. D431a]|uniref:UTP--glucose-1-phosphate uridylyltransferase GalU n=1 Tax=Vibrio sp. D431a TaxID=2837388 RepID=UPI0025548DF9|nr:UTP--glucose-1-phosphate uridylyltransferase GalU [Vibrio sp. D431a]MDK9790710.1 UTP--glucose-1-phosphate uridylyltransferase GalU [Vibrio sp. D431a]
MKAVVPVAGLGTRMLPATKAIPKEMLPIVDKPLIQYVVSEIVASGIKEIVLVTHSSKNSIENHFDTSFELETTLENRVKNELLEEVRSICPADVTIMHVRQGEAKGLGHAVLCAKPMIGDDDFAVVLPDVLIDEYDADLTTENLAAMKARFEQTGTSQVMVESVNRDLIPQYGIVDLDGAKIGSGESVKMTGIVEKPSIESAPSNLAVVGRYIFDKGIWSRLANTGVGAGGEIQLTDAIKEFMVDSDVEAHVLSGRSHDCGSKIGYAKAFIEYAIRHGSIGGEVSSFLCDSGMLTANIKVA